MRQEEKGEYLRGRAAPVINPGDENESLMPTNQPLIPNIGDPQFEEFMMHHLRNLGMKRDEITQELMNILGRVGQESRESNY